MEKREVIVYVDGYNFYYGLRKGAEKWKKLHPKRFLHPLRIRFSREDRMVEGDLFG